MKAQFCKALTHVVEKTKQGKKTNKKKKNKNPQLILKASWDFNDFVF